MEYGKMAAFLFTLRKKIDGWEYFSRFNLSLGVLMTKDMQLSP